MTGGYAGWLVLVKDLDKQYRLDLDGIIDQILVTYHDGYMPVWFWIDYQIFCATRKSDK